MDGWMDVGGEVFNTLVVGGEKSQGKDSLRGIDKLVPEQEEGVSFGDDVDVMV